MRAKVNLKPLQDKIRNLPAKAALSANREIQREFKDKFLDLISKGISPIEGNGRFPGYAAQTSRDKKRKKYPDSVRSKFPEKRRRPVNLNLSGKFLRGFQVVIRKLNVLEYGFFSQYGKDLEEGHRTGHNKQAKRPTIPIGTEKLAKTLELLILKLYRNAVNDYLRKK